MKKSEKGIKKFTEVCIKADLLSEYEANFDVSPKVWYNSYTEEIYYDKALQYAIVRSQYLQYPNQLKQMKNL